MTLNNDELAEQLAIISASTGTLVKVIAELKDLTTIRLESIEANIETTNHQLQQSIVLLTELLADDR